MPRVVGTAAALLCLASVALAKFAYPDGCIRSQFAQVPEAHRCDCARATRITSLDFLTFHYCHMQAHPWISIAMLTVALCLMFFFVADTTDRFTVPAVTYIAKTTNMKPCVAGATLLAFANGMPDLISCVASFSGASKHAGFGVGGLLGSGLVISCFTLGYLAVLSNGFPVDKRPFLRDVVFYLVALVGLVMVYSIGYVSVQACMLSLLLYCMYTVSVVWMHNPADADAVSKHDPLSPQDDKAEPEAEAEVDAGDAELEDGQPNSPKSPELAHRGHTKLNDKTYQEVSLHSPFEPPKQHAESVDSATERDDASIFDDIDEEISSEVQPRTYKEYLLDVTGWRDASIVGKCLSVPLFPVLWLRFNTVPSLNDSNTVRRADAVCWAFGIPLFCLFLVGSRLAVVTWPVVISTSLLSVILAILANLFASNKWYFASTVASLFLSAMWVFFIGHEIVAAMHVIGVSVGISGGTLGILFLAWGNSIGDFVGNASLARQGQVQMATAACIAGPLFNTLFGGGFSLLLGCIHSPKHTVPLWTSADKSTLRSGFAILGLTLVSLLALCYRYTMHVSVSRWFGVFLIVLYSVFCVVTVTEELVRG